MLEKIFVFLSIPLHREISNRRPKLVVWKGKTFSYSFLSSSEKFLVTLSHLHRDKLHFFSPIQKWGDVKSDYLFLYLWIVDAKRIHHWVRSSRWWTGGSRARRRSVSSWRRRVFRSRNAVAILLDGPRRRLNEPRGERKFDQTQLDNLRRFGGGTVREKVAPAFVSCFYSVIRKKRERERERLAEAEAEPRNALTRFVCLPLVKNLLLADGVLARRTQQYSSSFQQWQQQIFWIPPRRRRMGPILSSSKCFFFLLLFIFLCCVLLFKKKKERPWPPLLNLALTTIRKQLRMRDRRGTHTATKKNIHTPLSWALPCIGEGEKGVSSLVSS